MRVTSNSTSYNALYNIQQNRAKLDALQEKIASGVNYSRPSDDPSKTSLLLSTNDRLNATKQYQSNITKANTWLGVTNTALEGMADTIATAKGLVNSIGSGSDDVTELGNIKTQLTALREQLADMGNTTVQGQYVFAGANSDAAPFNRSVQSPPGSATYYNGDSTVNRIHIDANATEELNITGDQVLTASSPGVNILEVMDSLIESVSSMQTAATTNNTTLFQSSLSSLTSNTQQLEKGADQITAVQTEVASRLTRLDNASTLLDNTQNTMETIIGNIQEADYTALAVQLSLQETAFEASLSATAKITQMSLLDYL